MRRKPLLPLHNVNVKVRPIQAEPLIRNVSDTARWVAFYRAEESSRPDAIFSDPFARRLAGQRGEQIARSGPFTGKTSWPFVARTYLFDRVIQEQVQQGADMVVNLAAGLDARPYRMALPSALRWIEVDLPEILTHKEEILRNEKPVCALERIRLDLSDVAARRRLFQELGSKATRALIVSEGLIAYLTEEEVGALAQDLAVPKSFRHWLLDFGSPALMRMLQKKMGAQMIQAPLKFAPEKGPEFFTPYGWKLAKADSVFKTAAQIKRLPFWMRLLALLPDSGEFQAKRPWSAACLFERR
jgi:methyltransferase (TIGR00027 family)